MLVSEIKRKRAHFSINTIFSLYYISILRYETTSKSLYKNINNIK